MMTLPNLVEFVMRADAHCAHQLGRYKGLLIDSVIRPVAGGFAVAAQTIGTGRPGYPLELVNFERYGEVFSSEDDALAASRRSIHQAIDSRCN
ncbi:hypothetical protein [Burkholderia gladioli]|uniref:hypothetical protein n=1 Tax=Burkholderia gladioli TaxID=28095 RepID=UPI00163F33B2|nr:hypothetical protein [Burkholderia gladioli]